MLLEQEIRSFIQIFLVVLLQSLTNDLLFDHVCYVCVQLIENSVCLLRNLSYQVHREIPGSERYQEMTPVNQGPASSQKGGCFSSRKGKGVRLIHLKKNTGTSCGP